MRAFVILCSVIAAAYAANSGYNHGVNSGGSFGFGGVNGGQSYVGGLSGGGLSGVAGGQVGGPSLGSQGVGGPGYSAPGLSLSGGSLGGGASSGGQVDGLTLAGKGTFNTSYSAPAPAEPEFTKEFITYTAPAEEFNNIGDGGQVASSLKRNLRVIFIKGPENSGLENAALQLAKSASEERTAIYVLSKQADVSDLANKLQSFNNRNSYKPEVHFVKYKTTADAEKALRAIQAQYGLDDPASSHDGGGVAPVLDFTSKAPAPFALPNYSAKRAVGGNGGSSYLAPNKRVGGNADFSYLPPNKRV